LAIIVAAAMLPAATGIVMISPASAAARAGSVAAGVGVGWISPPS
jgi:hypothetical protein